MAYGNSYEERLAAIPTTSAAYQPAPELPSTDKILAAGSAEALTSGRPSYKRQFGPAGEVSNRPEYAGNKNAPQQFYGSADDIMQSEVIKNTDASPFATRAAIQNARLQDNRRLNLEYGDDVYGKTNVVATSTLPSGKANVFSGSSAPQTDAQRKAEDARMADAQRVAGIYAREAAIKGGVGQSDSQPVRGWYRGLSGQMHYDDSPIQQQEAAPDFGSMTIPQMAAWAVQNKKAATAKRAAAEEAKFGRELSSRERIAQMQEAGQESRFGRELDFRRNSPENEARNALMKAHERLYGAQAGTAEAAEYEAKQRQNTLAMLQDPGIKGEDRKRAESMWAALNKKGIDESKKFALEEYRAGAEYDPSTGRYFDAPVVKRAGGGMIEGYAVGGRIPRGFTDGSQVGSMQPAQNLDPILAEYGQYLQNAARVGVSPVPIQQYMAGKQQVSQFADGGMIERFEDGGEIGQRQTYYQNDPLAAVKKAGSRAYDSTIGAAADKISDWFVPAPKNNPIPIAQKMPEYRMEMTLEEAKRLLANPPEAEAASAVGPSGTMEEPARYASGGAINVSGRKVLGPGTGTSDSIPAVIDGHRPAALSTGEFVIPAHVVRAKGTEFFDKLLASYADKGGEDGE